MLIWSGYGFLAFLIPFLACLLGNVIFNGIVGAGYWDTHKWPMGVILLLTTPVLWSLGNRFNSQSGRVLIDKETGQEVTVRQRHDLFWIKLQYWAVVTLVGGIAAICMEFMKRGS